MALVAHLVLNAALECIDILKGSNAWHTCAHKQMRKGEEESMQYPPRLPLVRNFPSPA